jgi:hypothetical protein
VSVDESALQYIADRRHLVFEGGSRSQVKRRRNEGDLESSILAIVLARPGINSNGIQADLRAGGGGVQKARLLFTLEELTGRLRLDRTRDGNAWKYYPRVGSVSSLKTVPVGSDRFPGSLVPGHVSAGPEPTEQNQKTGNQNLEVVDLEPVDPADDPAAE